MVCAVNGHGGPIQSIVAILSEVSDRWQPTVASQLGPPGKPTSLERTSCRSISMVRPRGLRIVRAQLQLLLGGWRDRERLSTIHANGLTEALVVLPLAAVARLPVTVWVHNSQKPRPFELLEPMVKRLSRRWTWLAVSQTAADLVPWANPRIVPNPVGPDFAPVEKIRDDLFRVVYLAGTDRPNKGFDLLPEIIRGSRRENVRWTLYTSPPYSAQDSRCRSAWSDLIGDLSDRVEVLARTTDVPRALSGADVVIAPSRNESFNRVIAESMSTGTPVIASDIAPHRELVEASNAGLLFALQNPAEAGVLVDELCANRSVLAGLEAHARASSGRFSTTAVASAIELAWTSSLRSDRRYGA